jgi:hypothetical protein
MKKKLAASLSLAVALGLVTGCEHKPVTAAPPAAPAPLPQPRAGLEAMPKLPAPNLPNVQLSLPAEPLEEIEPHRHYTHVVHHRHAEESAPGTAVRATPPPGSAAGQEPTDATPIGRLSTAPATTGTRSYASIQGEIHSVQEGVNGIHRALSRGEQQTVTEIEMFLGKARNALGAGDLDGAHTLTVKARVLLNEITQ